MHSWWACSIKITKQLREFEKIKQNVFDRAKLLYTCLNYYVDAGKIWKQHLIEGRIIFSLTLIFEWTWWHCIEEADAKIYMNIANYYCYILPTVCITNRNIKHIRTITHTKYSYNNIIIIVYIKNREVYYINIGRFLSSSFNIILFLLNIIFLFLLKCQSVWWSKKSWKSLPHNIVIQSSLI